MTSPLGFFLLLDESALDLGGRVTVLVEELAQVLDVLVEFVVVIAD